MEAIKSYKERRQHKIRKIFSDEKNDCSLYGIVVPKEVALKYSGTMFSLTEEFRGMLVFQSGAKLSGL